jgi:hypothetical protein
VPIAYILKIHFFRWGLVLVIVMLCQGLDFETSLDGSNVWFSAFVIVLLVFCVVFNLKQAISKLIFKKHLQSVVVPSAISKVKNVSQETLIEICHLNALYQLSRLNELEVDCQGLIEMASSQNPFSHELPNIKRFLQEQIDIWNDPVLISTVSAQTAQGIRGEEDEKDWAKHTNDFIMNRSVGVTSMQVVSLGMTESPPLAGALSFPSSPTNGNTFQVESTKPHPSSQASNIFQVESSKPLSTSPINSSIFRVDSSKPLPEPTKSNIFRVESSKPTVSPTNVNIFQVESLPASPTNSNVFRVESSKPLPEPINTNIFRVESSKPPASPTPTNSNTFQVKSTKSSMSS